MIESNQYKLDLLREAIPYIRKFKGKTFVIKFSGKVTENRSNLLSLSEELSLLYQVGIKVCIIHGGGKQLTELAEKLGIAQTVVQGRRVTDDDTLELAKMIFAGKINTEILAALRNRGVESVGLSGIDGGVVHAERRPPKEVTDKKTGLTELVDYGHVGDVLEVNTKLVTELLDGGYMPVISSLAADDEGRVFNINADTIATEIALRLKAEKLILMSDVKGIYLDPEDDSTKLSRVTPSSAMELIDSGRATAGMIPKLQNLIRLVTGGVKSAHIISGTQRNALLSEVFTDQGAGTMFVDDTDQ